VIRRAKTPGQEHPGGDPVFRCDRTLRTRRHRCRRELLSAAVRMATWFALSESQGRRQAEGPVRGASPFACEGALRSRARHRRQASAPRKACRCCSSRLGCRIPTRGVAWSDKHPHRRRIGSDRVKQPMRHFVCSAGGSTTARHAAAGQRFGPDPATIRVATRSAGSTPALL